MRFGFFWAALAAAALALGCSESSTPADGVDGGTGGTDGATGTDGGPGGMDAGPTGTDAGPGPADAGPAVRIDAGPCDEWDPGVTFGDPIEATAGEWSFVEFPDSRCMNDTPTGIGINPSPTGSDKVVIYLEGGGACFDFVTCISVAHSDGFDASTMASVASSYGSTGIFDRSNEDNPLREWNFVFIPYCTGDVHAGSTESGYGGRTQVGYDNVGHYLTRIVPTFSDASEVLLSGSSAGGFGAAWNFDRVQTAFGCTPVNLLDDSGPPMDDTYMRACLQQQWRDLWGLDETVPPGCTECTNDEGGGLANFARYLAGKYPDRRFGLLSTMEDTTIRTFFGYGYSASCSSPTRMPADEFRAGLLDLRDRLIAPYDNFQTFYVEGDQHTFLGRPVGDVTTDGTGLGPWITQLIEGDAAWDDVGP